MECTWKTIWTRAGIVLTVSAVSVAAVYFGGTRIQRAVTTMTAPEKEKTLLTMLAANAMKEMPKTTDKSSLKPPLMSSLFMIKMTPHRAIATMEIHLPAGPVMVFTTRSRGLENSVMPPDASASSGQTSRQRAKRPKREGKRDGLRPEV